MHCKYLHQLLSLQFTISQRYELGGIGNNEHDLVICTIEKKIQRIHSELFDTRCQRVLAIKVSMVIPYLSVGRELNLFLLRHE